MYTSFLRQEKKYKVKEIIQIKLIDTDLNFIKGLKKYLTGSYLPALEIEVHPSKLGIQYGTKFRRTDQI